MKTVEITSDFSGYPNGKDERAFTTGEAPELSDAFADLIIGKGLASEVEATTKPAPTKAGKQKDDDK